MGLRRVGVLLAIVAIAGIGWTIAWRMSANAVERSVLGWIEDEKHRGRAWTCKSLTFSGFPTRIEAVCAAPAVAFAAAPVRRIEASRFVAHAGVLSPATIEGALTGPALIIGDGGTAQATWSGFEGRWIAGSTPDVSFQISALSLAGKGALSDLSGAGAGEIRARVRPAADRAADARVAEISLLADAVASPILDQALGPGGPAAIDATALVTRSDALGGAGHTADRLERWRLADGRLSVSSFAARRGTTRIEGSGELGIDEQRRPAGRLTLRAAGLEPFLKGIGLGSGALAIEAMTRGMLSPGKGGGPAGGPGIPLDLRNGRIHIGPIRTPVAVPPLY